MQEKRISRTKINLLWYTAFAYLDDMQSKFSQLHDKEAYRLYSELLNYIDKKFPLGKGDIDDTYVVIEQVIPPENG